MKIEIPYGEKKQVVDIPDRNVGEVVFPNDLPDTDESRLIAEALSRPLNSEGLDEFVSGAKTLLVIVNDGTRPTPTAKILDAIAPSIEGIETKFLVATGMHREPTEDEYRFIFGDRFESIRDNVFSHDSKNSEMMHLGKTSRGTELRFNKLIGEVDGIIVIGSVEPHYFAGYTGGRKAFLPGVAAYETIEQNHKLSLTLDAQTLRLNGNPVHEDMQEAMSFLRDLRVFSIMAVLDKNHRTCSAYAGDLDDTFEEGVKKADEVFVVPLKGMADIVVAVTSFPHDVDLYQSQKALDNAKYAVRDGGIVILVSACRTGVGPDTFLKLLGSAETPKEALDKIAEMYKLGYHKAAKMAEIGLRMKMFAVTGLEPDISRKAHLEPKANVQEAVNDAIGLLGEDSKVTFIMDAVITVPKIPSG